jgi:hypothetical protein
MKRSFVALVVVGLFAAVGHAGLVLHWKLDDTGTTFKEEVTGQTGTAVAVGTLATGQTALAPDGGNSVDFDIDAASYIDAGTVQSGGTYVAGSDTDYKVLTGAFTVTLWGRLQSSSGSDQMLFASNFNSNDGLTVGTRSNKMIVDFGNGRVTSTDTVAVDTTYLFAVRRDPTRSVFGGGTNANAISFWDGSTWRETQSNNNKNFRLQGLEIGEFNPNDPREANAIIDDVRVYDHALTQAELNALAVVPEPATFALLGLGCLMIFPRRRLRK